MKRWLKRSIALLVSFILVLGMNTMVFASGSDFIVKEVYLDKAMYSPGDAIAIKSDIKNTSSTSVSTDVNVAIYHLDTLVWQNSQMVSFSGGETKTVQTNWNAPESDFTGYLVKVSIPNGASKVSSIDVSSNLSRYPRYGYAVDFFPGETTEESKKMMEELAQVYHINLVQYYDWMWRHEKNAPDASSQTWDDMFGHTITKNSITQRINAGHSLNQKAMAYQMSYMAREGYETYGVSKEWGLYRSNTSTNITYNPNDPSTISNINQLIFPLEGKPSPILFTFDLLNGNWQDFMSNQYKDAINTYGFDGIQIDQMGNFWGANANYYDYNGNSVDLANSFATFTNYIKNELTQNNSEKNIVTMNAVNGGESDSFSSNNIIKEADTDFAFSELWGNSSTYHDIVNFVNWQRLNDGGKTMVLAAYMNQYDNNGQTYEYEDAAMTGVHSNTDGSTVYVTGFDEVGDKATITINVSETGTYSLVFRAANGTDTQASKNIYIDGEKYMEAFFDSTRNGIIPAEPDWSYYSVETSFTTPKTLYLSAGTHELTIQQDADNVGGDIRLDSVTLGTFDKNSVLLTNAAIAASGAMHIELGSGLATTSNSGEKYSGVSMLGSPYYPKANKSMRADLQNAIKEHYQFITAYENLLYDKDILPSDTGLQNISIANEAISGCAEAGKIWYMLKNKGNEYGILHFINLTGETDNDWRNVTADPSEKANLQVKYYIPEYKSIESIHIASPDNGCVSESLTYELGIDANGKYVSFTVPSLKYWDMVYIKWGNEISPETIEAEKSILSGVSVNNNHIDYSGDGFVDSYGELYDSVTMDIYVLEEGDYSLDYRYSNNTATDNKRSIYIDGRGYGEIDFVKTYDWDSWDVASKSVHLRKGVHRIVLLVQNEADGYINLDNMRVVPQ